MERLKLVEIDNEWYVVDGDKRHPIHLAIGTVGWSVSPHPYMSIRMTCFNKQYAITADVGGKRIAWVTHDEDLITELEISPGHPAAEFFKKTCTFDDGIERVVPITQTKPTQPY